MPEPGDQTEAELERTRKVVAASMAEQIATNDGAARDVVAYVPVEVEDDEQPAKASKKGGR